MLSGPRVTLRAVRRDDLQHYWRFRNDVELNVLAGSASPGPVTLERLEAMHDEERKKNDPLDHWFAIEADGKFIGQCILHKANPIVRVIELGITIGDRYYHGHGYGREAVGLLLDFAFRYLNMQRVCLATTSGNVRAIRSYLACGFVEEGRLRRHAWTDNQYEDEVWMGILREEWEALRAKSG